MGVPGSGDCLTIVPAGCEVSLEGTWLMLYPPEAAASWAWLSWAPTKLGSGGPALTTTCTGLCCGQDVPATGFVAMTMLAGMLAEVCIVAEAGISPASLRLWSATATSSPVTGGTVFMIG